MTTIINDYYIGIEDQQDVSINLYSDIKYTKQLYNLKSSTYANLYQKNDILKSKNIVKYNNEIPSYTLDINEGSNSLRKTKETSVLLIAIFIPILMVIILKFIMDKINK